MESFPIIDLNQPDVTLAEEILAYKQKHKTTIAKMALELGIPATNLHKWKNGTNPSSRDEENKLREFLKKGLEIFPKKMEYKIEKEYLKSTSDYIKLLEKNDEFFKDFNKLVIANLTALQDDQRRLLDVQKRFEALIKINLEHTGTVEALQQNKDPQEIHDKINKEILDAAGVKTDNSGDS